MKSHTVQFAYFVPRNIFFAVENCSLEHSKLMTRIQKTEYFEVSLGYINEETSSLNMSCLER